jgi:pyruvate-ferredoxin/flavodoxin oxidoreductase
VAREAGLGSRTNSVLQTCFFAVSGVLPRGKAIEKIKKAIEKTYRKKGAEVVKKNFDAVDRTLAALDEVQVPRHASGSRRLLPIVAAGSPPFVTDVVAAMLEGRGDGLPVSVPVDGTFRAPRRGGRSASRRRCRLGRRRLHRWQLSFVCRTA